MNVSLKTFMPAAAAAGLLTLSACGDVRDRAAKYMAEKPYSEYLELTGSNNSILIQSKLDSVAYRDIFNGTNAAKDSAIVAEFNKIASNTRGYESETLGCWQRKDKIKKSIIKQGITTRELQAIDSKDKFSDGDETRVCTFQHYADDWAYRTFFKDKGIMTQELAKKCDEVSKQIRP